MKHVDATDDLVDDFEPAKVALGPDGAPDTGAFRPGDEPPPRLCEAGPCIHYHRFGIQMDAARPIAARVEPGGKLSGEAPPMPFYTRIHHYCYPTVGVETKLGDMPVIECNRWKPISEADREEAELDIAAFMDSDKGKDFFARLEAWKAEKAKEATDAPEGDAVDDAVMFVTMHMADDCELLIYKNTADNQERNHAPLATMTPDQARELFDGGYLRTEFGPGAHVVAWIDRVNPQTKERARVARKTFEVTP